MSSTIDPSHSEDEPEQTHVTREHEEEEELPVSAPQSTNIRSKLRLIYSQLTWVEISGAFGDVGTFIPLFVALGQQRAIFVAPALFWAGAANLWTGLCWDVPMPVQPMKAIAALAIVDVGLTRNQVTTAGLCMGLFTTFLGGAGLMQWVNRLVPRSIVSGMQIGVGSSLAIHGLQMISRLSWASEPDCVLLALGAGALALYCLRRPSSATPSTPQQSNTQFQQQQQQQHKLPPPIGLYLLSVATLLALIKLVFPNHNSSTTDNNNDNVSPASGWHWEPIVRWTLSDLSGHDWWVGFTEGAIPQLPLTTLNSVISVCALAHTLFPEKRQTRNDDDASDDDERDLSENDARDNEERRNPSSSLDDDDVLSCRQVALSVGLLNLIVCPLGGLPCCHGAGGLAGQYQMGARHGASIVFLGTLKIGLAVTMGTTVLHLLDAFPQSILGIMLTMAGHELALTGLVYCLDSSHSTEAGNTHESSRTVRERVGVAFLTAIVILGTKKTHYGAAIGWVADWIYNYDPNRQENTIRRCWGYCGWRQERTRASDYAPAATREEESMI